MLVYVFITSVYSPKEESRSVRWSQDRCQLQEAYNQAVVLSSPSPPVFRFCLDVLSSVSSTPVRIRSRIRGCVHLFGLVQSGSVSLSVPLLLQSTGPSERFFFLEYLPSWVSVSSWLDSVSGWLPCQHAVLLLGLQFWKHTTSVCPSLVVRVLITQPGRLLIFPL